MASSRLIFRRKCHPQLNLSGELVRHFVDPLAPIQFEMALEIIRKHGVDIVLSNWLMPGVIAAAQSLAVPVVPLHYYPMSVMADDDFPVLTRWHRLTARCRYPASAPRLKQSVLRYYRSLAPRLTQLRAAHGLADDDGLLPGAGGVGLALFPRSLMRGRSEHVFTSLPLSKPKALPPDIEAFIKDGAAPALVYRGSSLLDRSTTQSVVSELLTLGQRYIVVWGDERTAQELSPSCLDLGRFPIASLLPYVAAVVHHAGINISAEVLASGKPSLAIPFGGDQYDNAYRLHDLGASILLPASQITAKRLRAALCRLLDPGQASFMANAAAKLAPQPTDPAAAVGLIQRVRDRRLRN